MAVLHSCSCLQVVVCSINCTTRRRHGAIVWQTQDGRCCARPDISKGVQSSQPSTYHATLIGTRHMPLVHLSARLGAMLSPHSSAILNFDCRFCGGSLSPRAREQVVSSEYLSNSISCSINSIPSAHIRPSTLT